MRSAWRRASAVALAAVIAAAACTGDSEGPSAPSTSTTSTASTTKRPAKTGPLPRPVNVRQEPDGVGLADPNFEPLPGARADFGRLGGSVYRIEMPRDWNGRLVLFMHGYEELGPEVSVSAPDARTYLIAQGIAWGASSFSSTSQIPGRAADETAALWDFFARKYGRPTRTYVTGLSMGGAATHIAAERYGNRFDGALSQCGAAGLTPGMSGLADFFVTAAYAAGVTQAEFDASTDVGALVRDRIRPALGDPATHDRFERLMVDLTGGPRLFDREGFRMEEETNWRRAELALAAQLLPNRDTRYRLSPLSRVSTEEFGRAVIRLPTNDGSLAIFLRGNDITGDLQMPLLTMHTTGDGQVPIEHAPLLRRRVEAAGKDDLLVQRVIRDPGHCGFATTEWEVAFEALSDWVERGRKPKGDDVLVDDLRELDGAFELLPRPGSPEADTVPGAGDRLLIRGNATLDGAPFDARFLGAIVRRDGLSTACQYTLPPVENGRFEITVLAESEATGCGGPGAEVVLWTFAQDMRFHSTASVPWPHRGRVAEFDPAFQISAPGGAASPTMGFVGEVVERDGHHLPPGTRIEAYAGQTRCGVASLRHTGSYSGYVLTAAGPDSIAGCGRGARLTFRVDGRLAVGTATNEPDGNESLDLIVR